MHVIHVSVLIQDNTAERTYGFSADSTSQQTAQTDANEHYSATSSFEIFSGY